MLQAIGYVKMVETNAAKPALEKPAGKVKQIAVKNHDSV